MQAVARTSCYSVGGELADARRTSPAVSVLIVDDSSVRISENPKILAGFQKTPLISPVPATSLTWLAEAHLDGAIKYGALNWREPPHSLSSLIDAAVRHLLALQEGEDLAADSGLPHVAHIMSGMSIILDVDACGTLIDDRVNCRPNALAKVQVQILEARNRRAT